MQAIHFLALNTSFSRPFWNANFEDAIQGILCSLQRRSLRCCVYFTGRIISLRNKILYFYPACPQDRYSSTAFYCSQVSSCTLWSLHLSIISGSIDTSGHCLAIAVRSPRCCHSYRCTQLTNLSHCQISSFPLPSSASFYSLSPEDEACSVSHPLREHPGWQSSRDRHDLCDRKMKTSTCKSCIVIVAAHIHISKQMDEMYYKEWKIFFACLQWGQHKRKWPNDLQHAEEQSKRHALRDTFSVICKLSLGTSGKTGLSILT